MAERVYSKGNGRIGLGLAALCLAVAAFDGYRGDMPLAALFGFAALYVGLTSMDDLVWQGSRDDVVVPLRWATGAAIVLAAAWAVAELLF